MLPDSFDPKQIADMTATLVATLIVLAIIIVVIAMLYLVSRS